MRHWEEGSKDKVYQLFEIKDTNLKQKKTEGRFYAQLLKDILDRTSIINYDTLPNDTLRSQYTLMSFEDGLIRLYKDEFGQYKFSEATLINLGDIYSRIIHLPRLAKSIEYPKDISLIIRQKLLAYSFLNESTLFVKNWQWLILIPLLFISVILYALSTLFSKIIFKRFFTSYEYVYNLKVGKSFGLMVGTLFFFLSLKSLMLYNANFFISTLNVCFHILALFSFIWFLWQVNNGALYVFEQKTLKTQSKFDDLLVPMLRTAIRLVLILLTVFLGASILKYDVTNIVAGLGIGSLAVALAAKDTIENLFGSITVVLDRPFHIGDWVVIGDSEGSIETLGFRSTRIRTFYDSVITVPNSKLISAVVDNMGKRKFRRIKINLALTYKTPPDKIESFCEGIRELIRNHPYTRKDNYHVYLNNFGTSSLDILLYCFLEVPDWPVELREKERLFLDIIKLAHLIDVEFAYPTQTLFMQEVENKKVNPNFVSANEIAKQLSSAHFTNNLKPGPVEY